MRLAAALALALVTACAPTAVTNARMPAAGEEPTILATDGGLLRPIRNGGRVAIPDGWATLTFSPLPLQRDQLDLDVGVLDAAGRPADAAVQVTYESLDMDHGVFTQRATAHERRYRVPVQIVMPGRWRFTVSIERGGQATRLVIVVPDIG